MAGGERAPPWGRGSPPAPLPLEAGGDGTRGGTVRGARWRRWRPAGCGWVLAGGGEPQAPFYLTAASYFSRGWAGVCELTGG